MGALKKGKLLANTLTFPPEDNRRKNALIVCTPITFENCPSGFYAPYLWSDGTHIYYSPSEGHYVLDGRTWKPKEWNMTDFSGNHIWTDGTDIYYTLDDEVNYILVDGMWETADLICNSMLSTPKGSYIWSDGTNIFSSMNASQLVLDGNTWKSKNWNITANGTEGQLNADMIWSDGSNIYYSEATSHFVRDGDTWRSMTWENEAIHGRRVWTDGTNIYCDDMGGYEHFVFNDGTWEQTLWNGHPSRFDGINVWSDGVNIYHSKGSEHYVIDLIPVGSAPEVEPKAFMNGWDIGQFVRAML